MKGQCDQSSPQMGYSEFPIYLFCVLVPRFRFHVVMFCYYLINFLSFFFVHFLTFKSSLNCSTHSSKHIFLTSCIKRRYDLEGRRRQCLHRHFASRQSWPPPWITIHVRASKCLALDETFYSFLFRYGFNVMKQVMVSHWRKETSNNTIVTQTININYYLNL